MSSSDPRPDDPVAQVVVVCHANVARSPLAMVLLEREARDRLGPRPDVWVRSAGVRAMDGHPAAEGSQRAATDLGLDLSAHRSALLSRADVEDTDLVVTMSERQRGHVVRMHPGALHRTFTLPELARLGAAVDPPDPALPHRARLRDAVRRASHARPHVARPEAPEDVADPFGGPEAGFAAMADRVGALVAQVAEALFGPR